MNRGEVALVDWPFSDLSGSRPRGGRHWLVTATNRSGILKHMEQPPNTTRTIDVTGLPEEVIRYLEDLVDQFRGKPPRLGGTITFSSREEWIKAIRDYAGSHEPIPTEADDSRESIYAGQGE
jgi:hypothetical protein